MNGGFEFFEDKASFEAADDVFDGLWLFAVVFFAAEHVVEYLYEVDDVVLHVFRARGAALVQVKEFELEAKADALDDDIVRVQVAVVFFHAVDAFNAGGERVEEVDGGERAESFTGLPVNERAEQFALDEFGDEEGDGPVVEVAVLRIVLDDDAAVAELVEFFGVVFAGLVAFVPLWVEEFGRSFNAGGEFFDEVDFAFPALAEELEDFVFAVDDFAGREVKWLDGTHGGKKASALFNLIARGR